MRTAVFTIISPNYRHFARVLMDSVERHHPEWERFVLLVGESPGAPRHDERFTVVPLDAMELPHHRQFSFRYTILELNTAVKPWMFAHLFAGGYDRVIYLDPDVVLYSPLAELDASRAFLTLTPHLTGSIDGDVHPSERTILQAGTYNLGFLAVQRDPQLDAFLNWWKEKLEFQCVVDLARGLFVDQKWIDLTPGLFANVSILRHEGYNVAYWNLGQRSVEGEPGTYTANGQPLRFFHFSGFDPAWPELVSRHDTRRKIVASSAIEAIIRDYERALRSAGYEESRGARYAFGAFSDGTAIPDIARIAYRNDAALQASAGEDPFEHPALFIGLRDAPRQGPLAARAGVLSYRFLSRARPLVRLIPRPLRTAMRDFLLGRKGSASMAPRARVAETGLNVVGYLSRDTGVGEAARLFLQSCVAAGLPAHPIDVERGGGLAQQPAFGASIYHVNADQMPVVRSKRADVFEASVYNIGSWHWELAEFPDAWLESARGLDEIWAPSAFIQSAVSRKVGIPVVHMPHGIEVTEIDPCAPQEFGVPQGRFTFLCMFDFASVGYRKNPLGAIEAFHRAFNGDPSVALLIKAGRAADHAEEYTDLQARLRGMSNVYLTGEMLSRGRVNGLLSACDAVVSLHRSEGFGLILAEAMDLGKPVVATAWSGNMDFMNGTNSCLVDYTLTPLDRTYVHYEAGQQWAEPDLDHAATLMRRLVDDPGYRARIGEEARKTIRTRFSPVVAGKRYRERVAILGLAGNVRSER